MNSFIDYLYMYQVLQLYLRSLYTVKLFPLQNKFKEAIYDLAVHIDSSVKQIG